MTLTNTPADELRSIPTKWMWVAVFFVIAVCNGLLTPWDSIRYLLEHKGLGDDGNSLIAFVAGYTLPLSVGFGVIVFLKLTGAESGISFPSQLFAAAVILYIAGEVARSLGLGLLPNYGVRPSVSVPGYARPLLIVLEAYFNTYGWPLMFSALAIGSASGIQVERWLHASNSST